MGHRASGLDNDSGGHGAGASRGVEAGDQGEAGGRISAREGGGGGRSGGASEQYSLHGTMKIGAF